MSRPLVEVVRGDVVDVVHRGTVAVVAADGRLEAFVGDPLAKIAYWRSAAKPFQAVPLVSTGAARRWSLGEEDLAIVSASHNGEPLHIERVEAILRRIGCAPDDLICGIHPPLDVAAARALEREGADPTPLHNNCAGNHAGMLALARHLGAPTTGYETSAHPVQREILDTIGRFADVDVAEVVTSVDGCGVPCFGTSVYHLALAFARLAAPDGLPDDLAAAARAVFRAMAGHPYLVAGRSRVDTALMEVGRGALVAKGGAGGVLAVGLADGRGIALKLDDGGAARPPVTPTAIVVVDVLRQLDAVTGDQLAALDRYARPPVETLAGGVVGEARPVFALEPTARVP